MFLLLLLPLLFLELSAQCDTFFYPEGCDQKSASFKRQVFKDNERREMSIYARAHSSESIMLHCLLIFSDDAYHFHNTLLFNPLRLEKYDKILHHSDFPFNNEFMLMTRGSEFLVQYDVAPRYSPYFSGTVDYDAVLSLDYFSSMWHEYNTFTIERSKLTLLMLEPSEWHSPQREDFHGFYKLWCDRNVSLKYCHVALDTNQTLRINDHVYLNYNLTIRPNQKFNLLPPDLFVYWQFHAEKELNIYVGDELLLYLNGQFEYGLNEETNEIVLGVDVMHYFQKIEYGVEAGYYKLYYAQVYHDNDDYATGKLIIVIFIGTILSTMFYWITSTNYDILYNLLRGEMMFEYPVRLVLSELLSILIAVILWILTLIFADSYNGTVVYYTNSYHKQRLLLYMAVSFYNVLLLSLCFVAQRRLFSGTLRYYYSYAKQMKAGKKATVAVESRSVIVRNIAIISIMVCNLAFILNYLSQEKVIYAFILIILSLALVYYYTKLLLISILYLIQFSVGSDQVRFIFLTLANAAVYLFFLGFSLETIYLAFLREVNSMYSESLLWDFVIIAICIVSLLAVCAVLLPMFKFRFAQQKK